MARGNIPMLGNHAPHANPWEVRSASGLEGLFAEQDDAEFYAQEIRESGAKSVSVGRQERGTRPRVPRRQLQQNPTDRLFSGVYPTGIVYADKEREVDGDYMRVAFLPYNTLRLQWSPGNHPRELVDAIEQDAAAIIARRGEAFEVSSSGQTVILGGSQRRPSGAPPLFHAPQGRPPGVPNRSNPGRQLGDKYVLGTYGQGSRVQLGVWEFPSYEPKGVIMPGAWVQVVGNYADTTGYVVVRDEGSGARYEVDGRQPLVEIDVAHRTFQHQKRR